MSDSELTELRKGNTRRLLLIGLIIIGLGFIIIIIVILYMNIGDNTGDNTGGWCCVYIKHVKIFNPQNSLNNYYIEFFKKINTLSA